MKREVFSVFISLLLMIPLFVNSLGVGAQAPGFALLEGLPPQETWNGTYISWDKLRETWNDTWSWLNQAWEFGPYPTFRIYLLNGTEVTKDNFIPLGENGKFRVVIEVRKAIFAGIVRGGSEVTLGRAGLHWHMELKDPENGTQMGWANVDMEYVYNMATHVGNETNTWHISSMVFNRSAVIAEPGQPPEQAPGREFYVWDNVSSSVTEDSDMWTIEIVGFFNETITPVGPFWVNLHVTDSQDTWVDFGYAAWTAGASPDRGVAVGKPGFIFGGWEDTWSFQKLDMENRTVYSVSRGDLWKMRVNVTSSDLANVTVAINLPWDTITYVNRTDWHQETITEKGGWVYNETLGTYEWDPDQNVTRTVEAYGPFLEKRWIHTTREPKTIDVTRRYWRPEGGYDLVNETIEVWPDRMFLVYDHATHSFTMKQGYSYWAYDPVRGHDRDYLIIEPLDTSDPTTRFYSLSTNDCSWSQIGEGEYMIEFVGSFSNTTYSEQTEYWIENPRVYTTDGRQIWCNWEEISPADFQIAVGRLVCITKVFDSQGREIKWGTLQVDPGSFFTIQGKLQGAGAIYDDLDGMGVTLWGWGEGYHSANESYHSEVEIRLIKDLTTGTITSVTYNRTWWDAYLYGSYQDWTWVNVTDWHQEYNETTGNWEWVEAPRAIWNLTTLTGWHWEHLALNQTEYAINPSSPDIWINTRHQWIPNENPAFIVKTYDATTGKLTPLTYATLTSADMSLVKGIVTVDLNVTLSANIPQTRYGWDLRFYNMTLGRDESQGWGMHEVTSWTTEPTYYVTGNATGNVPWYVTSPETPLYTLFEGERYKLDEIPYITINATNYAVQVRTDYDWWSGEERTEVLMWDEYDPSIGEQPRYYLLLNGTKVVVREGYRAQVRSIALNTTDAYRIVDRKLNDTIYHGMRWVVVKEPVANSTVLETIMDHSERDWSQGYEFQPDPGDPGRWEWTEPYYYELLNGTRIYRDMPFESQAYNWTTDRWDLSNELYYNETVTSVLVNRLGRGVRLNNTLLVLLYDYASDWQPLPDGTGYYLVMSGITYESGTKQYNATLAGTAIVCEDPWVPDHERFVSINGDTYLCRDWPEDYYEGTYENRTIVVKSGWQGHVRSFYYTLWPEGLKHEMPYPGARATSWWDLEGTESEGQMLPTYKYFTLNGTKYVLYLSEKVGEGYYILYNGTRRSVTWPTRDPTNYYCLINGVESWNATQFGWYLNLGTYSWRGGGQLTATIPNFVTTTGFDEEKGVWTESEWERTGRDRENATMYLTALNGTRYNLQSAFALYIWKVEIGGKSYYTFNDWTQDEQIYDNETGEYRWKNYIVTINGTKVYFDWEQNPASFVQEYRVLVPGTNYTRLIPYTWGDKYIFDTIHIHNITITENVTDSDYQWSGSPWQGMTTGVFYANGTEVPAGTTFKVIGGPTGPSTITHYDGTNYTRSNPNDWWVHHLSDEQELPWMAPWTQASWSYMVTLNGTLLYFVPGMHDERDAYDNLVSRVWSPRQWDWTGGISGGNKTVKVTEGGYAVFLNDTIRVDVTTEWTQGWPDQYLVMENGTHFNVQYDDTLHRWITMINDKFYTFRDVHTLCNLTDSGVEYTVYDLIHQLRIRDQWERYHRILTPTSTTTTLINSTHWMQNSLWMNATSDSVLHDGTVYYLINASDLQRLNLTAVSSWWNETSMGKRDKIFKGIQDDWLLEYHKPLYNITIGTQEYFVLDPSPIGGAAHSNDRWWDRWSAEPWNALYRYPETFNVTLDGEIVTIRFKQPNATSWMDRPFPDDYPNIYFSRRIIDLYNGLDVEEEQRWKAALNVTFGGETMTLQLEDMNIYKKHIMWGELYTQRLKDMDVMTVRPIWDIVVGAPDWGLWGLRYFATVEETGAVDLDGDLSTTDDQYFVRRLHNGTDFWARTQDRMWVEIMWNPNSSRKGDEVHVRAWTGRVRTSWSFEWNEYFTWYHASNLTIVSNVTMAQINATIWNSDTGLPNPGYWDIAYMAKNHTWADMLAEAERMGWDWITENKHEWEWIWFGMEQDYQTSWVTDGMRRQAGIGLRYEFAGLSLFNLTEQTHYFMPETVGNVTFISPGEAFGNPNATDTMLVGVNDTVTFGVTYTDVNGTIFPSAGGERSMWGWYDSVMYGADFKSPNFDERPTESVVNEITLAWHFSGTETTDVEVNNKASLKLDQHIGDWTLDPNVIDGRTQNVSGVDTYLRGNEVLLNRSLAANWYVTAYTDIRWDVSDEKGETVQNDNVTESNNFNLRVALANANFATVKIGSTYDWDKPVAVNDTVRTLNVTSKTTPIGVFEASFQKEDGKSSAGFDITAMMYFLTVGFPKWDGYAVYNDPELESSVSKGMRVIPLAELSFANLLINPVAAVLGGSILITVDVTNLGTADGICTLNLIINEIIVESKDVLLMAGETKTVAFWVDLYGWAVGDYTIEVAGLKGTFKITRSAAEAFIFVNLPIVIAGIAGAAAAIIAVIVLRKRRKPAAVVIMNSK